MCTCTYATTILPSILSILLCSKKLKRDVTTCCVLCDCRLGFWHFLALIPHFFEHSYTSEQPPFNQFEFHTKKAVSRPDAAVDERPSRGRNDEMRSTRNSQMSNPTTSRPSFEWLRPISRAHQCHEFNMRRVWRIRREIDGET